VNITRIALVSHDYRIPEDGRWDYSQHIPAINRVCDQAGCDTVLYALYTWDERTAGNVTHAVLFDYLENLRIVVLEAGKLSSTWRGGTDLVVQAWVRGEGEPRLMKQRFGRLQDLRNDDGAQFVASLPERLVANALVVICGESNIVQLQRKPEKGFRDHYGAVPQMHRLAPVILNPIHDYMRRYEMKAKRRHYSEGGRWVLSVWNKGKGKEARVPWTVYYDGQELTDLVEEIPSPVQDRPDIAIGVCDLAKMALASTSDEQIQR
jgi:hypothetical protein